MRAAAPRLAGVPQSSARATLWLLLIPLQVGVGYALAEGSVYALLAVAATVAAMVVLLYPRQALLVGLAVIPFTDVAVKGVPIGEVLVTGAVFGLFMHFLAGDDRLRLDRPPAWLAFGFALMLYLLLISTIYNGALDGEGLRRFGHLAVGAMLAWVLAARVVQPASAANALLVGMLISGLIGLAELPLGSHLVGDASYRARLTGLFGDPNVAGFYIVTLGTASLGFVAKRQTRLLIGGALLVLMVATLSRTALIAAILIVIWVAASQRGRVWLPIFALVISGLLAFQLAQHVKETGPFQDRGDSDWFRRAVYHETLKRMEASPVFGEGAAPHRVLVQGGRIFPHNSYLAAVIEGGVFWLLAWLALLVSAVWKLAHARPRNLLLEGGLIGLFIVAINLGEVLFELPTFVLIGLALAYLSTHSRSTSEVSPLASSRPGGAPPALAHQAPASR